MSDIEDFLPEELFGERPPCLERTFAAQRGFEGSLEDFSWSGGGLFEDVEEFECFDSGDDL